MPGSSHNKVIIVQENNGITASVPEKQSGKTLGKWITSIQYLLSNEPREQIFSVILINI